ncbi:MAG: MFS transporter [candidate division Zixibacteria bacterium]|nr:MFS transporter [Candidatus Tariuqbacter arcticus]
MMSDAPNGRKIYLDTNLQILFGVTLTAILGVSSLTPAFPKIVREFNISPENIGLLITIFTFPGIFLTPVMGVFADRWGRKKILVPSLMLFGIAGFLCFFVRDFNLLLLLRFFQGVGAASLGSINVTIIGDLYSGKERAAAMGYNASVLSIGTAAYPLIGGALATFGWYYPFILPLIGIPIGFLVLFTLKNPEPLNDQRLLEYLAQAWQSVKKRQVVGLFIACIISFIILFGTYLTYFPFLVGYVFGKSPFVIGIIMSCASLSTALTASQLGKLVKIYSERTLLKTAYLLYALSMLMVPFIHNVWLLLIPIMIFGVGNGINFPIIQTLLAGMAPINQRAAVMSLNGMVLRLGQTLGPILIGIVFTMWGLNGAFFAGAGFAICLIGLVTLMIGQHDSP